MSDGTMHAEMTLGTGGFTAPLSAAKGAFESVAEVFSKHILGIGAATMTAAGMFEGFKSVIDKGAELKKTSEQIGQSAEDTVRLQRAWKQAGEETDGIGNKINMLQAALSGVSETGEKTADTFAAMGLNMQELRGMNAAKQLEAIGEAFEKITSQEDRIKVMRNLFGRGGGEMMGVMEQTKGMSDPLSARAQILAASATTFKKTAILLRDAGSVVQSFFVGVAEKVAPVLNPLLERFNKLDFSKWGEQAGNVVVVLDQAFSTGKFGELFALSLKIGAMEAVNWLTRGLFFSAESFVSSLKMIPALLSSLFSGDTLSGLFRGLVGIVGTLGRGLLEAFKTPLSYISAAFDMIVDTLKKGLADAWNSLAGTSAGKTLGMSEWKVDPAKSFEDYRQNFLNAQKVADEKLRIATDQLANGDKTPVEYTDAIGNKRTRERTAAEGNDSWDAALGRGLAPAADAFVKSFQERIEAAQKAGGINLFGGDLEKLKGQLGAIVSGLLEGGKTLDANKKTGGPGETTAEGGSAPKAVSDRLAAIGGFVGGSYSALNDYNRKTADNTARMVKLQEDANAMKDADYSNVYN